MRTIITPERAERILERNTMNRPVNKSAVSYLVSEIKSKRFIYNGESIIIGLNGSLLDGQHRLLACISAGEPIEVELIEDVPMKAMLTIDTGKQRNGGDVLGMSGAKSSKNLAAMIREILTLMSLRNKTDDIWVHNNKIPNQVIVNYYETHKEPLDTINDFSRRLYSHGVGSVVPQGLIGADLYLFSYINPDKAIDFFRELILGLKISGETNIVNVLRNKLLNDKLSTKTKMTPKIRRKLLLKTFMLYIRNEDRQSIFIREGEDIKFPNSVKIEQTPNINYEKIENL